MSFNNLEDDAKELYESGYKPDDSILGAVLGADPVKETKERYKEDGVYSQDQIDDYEAREINRTIRENSYRWEQERLERESKESSDLIEFLYILYFVFIAKFPDSVLEAPAFTCLERLSKEKKGKTFAQRFQKEYVRVYISRILATVLVVLSSLFITAYTIYHGVVDMERIPYVIAALGAVDIIYSAHFLKKVYSDSWNVVLCFPQELKSIVQKVKTADEFKTFCRLLMFRLLILICGFVNCLEHDADEELLFIWIAFVVVTIIFWCVLLEYGRKATFKRFDQYTYSIEQFEEKYNKELLPAYEQLDIPSIKKAAWKKIRTNLKIVSITLAVITVLAGIVLGIKYGIPAIEQSIEQRKQDKINRELRMEREEEERKKKELLEAKMTPEFLAYIEENRDFYKTDNVTVDSLCYEDEIPEYSKIAIYAEVLDFMPYLDYSDGMVYVYASFWSKDGTRIGADQELIMGNVEGYKMNCTLFTYGLDYTPEQLDEITIQISYFWVNNDNTEQLLGPTEEFVIRRNESFDCYEDYLNSRRGTSSKQESVEEVSPEKSAENTVGNTVASATFDFMSSDVAFTSLGCDKMAEYGYGIYVCPDEISIDSLPSANEGRLYVNMDYLNINNEYVPGDQVCVNEESEYAKTLTILLNDTPDILSDNGYKVKVYYSWIGAGSSEVVIGPTEEFVVRPNESFDCYEDYLNSRRGTSSKQESVEDVFPENSVENTVVSATFDFMSSDVAFDSLGCDKMAEYGYGIYVWPDEISIDSLPSANEGRLYVNMDYLNINNEYVPGDQVCINEESEYAKTLTILLNDTPDILRDNGYKVKVYYSWIAAGSSEVVTGPKQIITLNIDEYYFSYEDYLANHQYISETEVSVSE